MVTSTGCPFHCNFCAIPSSGGYRKRSPGNVVDEMEICYKEHNIREIDFFDAVMFLDKPRILRILTEIRKRSLRIEWSCRSRVDTVDEEILREAARSGCRQIYYGIESVDISILRSIHKEINIQQIKQAIKWSKKFGIKTMGFFMVGNPGETKESVWKTITFAKDLGLDFIQVSRTISKPGTALDKLMIEKTGRDYWREHIENKKIEKRLPTPWVNLRAEELENLTKRFYLQFYLRPRIILFRLLQLKSLNEFIGYIRVAMKMIAYKSELRETKHHQV